MKKLLIVASLCLTSVPVLPGVEEVLTYDHKTYRSPMPYSNRVSIQNPSKDEQYWLKPGDKIVTVTLGNGKKQRFVLSKDQLYRLPEDLNWREELREWSGLIALVGVGMLCGSTITWAAMQPSYSSHR